MKNLLTIITPAVLYCYFNKLYERLLDFYRCFKVLFFCRLNPDLLCHFFLLVLYVCFLLTILCLIFCRCQDGHKKQSPSCAIIDLDLGYILC